MSESVSTNVAGLLLAAGAGRRMGQPKALLRRADGVPVIDAAVGALFDGGCTTVTVVLGAAAGDATALLDDAGWVDDPEVRLVVADNWADGMGASLQAGLESLATSPAEAALITLVDLPDVTGAVHSRVLASASGPGALARATYDGRPGHPVLIGRHHWAGAAAAAEGDRGARSYLDGHECADVSCEDLATGVDLDHPDDPRPTLDQ